MWQGQKGEGWGRETSAKGKANPPRGGGGGLLPYITYTGMCDLTGL